MESIRTARLELVPLSAAFVDALKRGDRAAAARAIGAGVGRWPTIEPAHFVQLHLAQLSSDPAGLTGFARAIVVVTSGGHRRVVGSIGLHGPPDDRGRLEIGFSLEPAARRRGYAAEAIRALIEWARSRFGVSRFVVSLPAMDETVGPVPIEIGFGPADWSDDSLRALLPPAGRPRPTRP